MGIIKHVAVILDVSEVSLEQHVLERVRQLDEDTVVRRLSEEKAGKLPDFIKLSEDIIEKNDLRKSGEGSVESIQRFVCFVTDNKTRQNGMVAYAMHCLQIPVLSLTKGQKAKGNDDAEHWVSTILYKDLDGSHTDPLAAVNEFFTFPDKVGELLAVEGRDSQLTLQYCRELRSYLQRAWSAEVKLVGPNGCDMSEEGLDGTKCGETDNVEEQVEVESGIHAPLVKELLGNSQLESTHQNDHLLHGAMYALNRHENLPIIRYRLQRGVNIILCRPMSSSLEKLFNKFSRMRGGAEDVRRSFIDAVKSLLQFEGRWLDMPRRRVVLIREGVAHSWSAWLGNEVIHPLVDWIPVDVKAGNIADHCASLEASVKKAVRRLSR